MKVDKRPRKEKNLHLLLEVVENKKTPLSGGQQKKICVGRKLRKCFTVPFPLKNLIFLTHDWILEFWICIC